MPRYEYVCDQPSCELSGRLQEQEQPIERRNHARCTACNAAVERRPSRTSFQLKGTGWYATDYKGK